MAYFPICPLIDQKCFLGITDDADPGCIIVSLGKKIIIRFRLADQKQLSCWTPTRKLSTPVFYDTDRKDYFAIFNGEIISRWCTFKRGHSGKYKLSGLVHSLYCVPGIRPVLLFRNGNLGLIDLEGKNSVTILKENVSCSDLLDCGVFNFCGRHYLCMFYTPDGSPTLNFIPVSESNDGLFSIRAVRKESECKMSCFTVVEDTNHLITLWSDGSLFSFDLNESSRSIENFPGQCISVFTNINCKLPCVILSLENHVIVYGADSNGEGAEIVWVESGYGVIQNTLHLKLYSNPPRLWKVGNSYLITLIGQNLIVIPYTLKSVPKLESVLAAHLPSESFVQEISWEKTVDSRKKKNNTSQPSDTLKSGHSGFLSNKEIITSFIDKNNIKEVLSHLKKLSDVPDKFIIDTVICCLNSKQPSKTNFLLQALSFPLLKNAETLSYLREKLSFESAFYLMELIYDELKNENCNDCLISWLSLLMDAYYQQYLLTKDESVVKQLENMKLRVDTLISNMINFQELYKVLTGVLCSKVSLKSSVQYSVDKFRLY